MLGITPAPRAKIDDYTNGGGMIEHRFNPYKDNGGSTAAIAGDDFVIIASDTRLTNGGYGIVSRNQTKLFPLGDKMVLGATGCWADVLTLTKLVEARIQV
jgi:20S proteasome subunit beta 6